MSLYINGMGNISPQQSWNDESLLIQPFDYRSNVLKCVEPEYEEWLDPRQLRRMSRIIRMGICSALMALREARLDRPHGIITGTGYGCLEDTGTFLSKLVENKEQALNPTPFIQSTHNTIGSTIAMLLQCQGYNQTYAHTAFSFESVLLDALMHAQEQPQLSLLLGGVDEITTTSHQIQSRFNLFRRKIASSLNVLKQSRRGTINGEGAAFFAVSGERSKYSFASIDNVRTLYKPTSQSLRDGTETFIRESGLRPAEIDLVITGKSGDKKHDSKLQELIKTTFGGNSIGHFKHLCGEYPVASAFATWLGARILRERRAPEVVVQKPVTRALNTVLIINAYLGTHYSLIMLKSCRDTI